MPPATLTSAPTADRLALLDRHIAGRIVTPADHDYDECRQGWNLSVDLRPAAIAYPESADDVVSIVYFANEHGLRIAPQGTGHGAHGLEDLDDVIVVKTERMRGVSINPRTRTATAQAGAQWIDVVEPAARHGLAALSGSAPDVGVVGYTLGGGMGWLGRKHGLASNSVRSIQIVTADGRLVRADHEHHPELFWALRGGGGSFGIVTAIEVELFEHTEAYAGTLFFGAERAAEVLKAYVAWTQTTPDEVSASGRILRFPDLEIVPEPMRGRAFAAVEAVYSGAGGEAQGAAIVAPLRALRPEIDTFSMVPMPALSHLHMDPPEPIAATGDGVLTGELDDEAIDALLAAADLGGDSPLMGFELRQLGGAVARRQATHGAAGAIEDAAHAFFGGGLTVDAEAKAAVLAKTAEIKAALAPWALRRGFLNFAGAGHEMADLFPDGHYERLVEIRGQYDPRGLFRANRCVELDA